MPVHGGHIRRKKRDAMIKKIGLVVNPIAGLGGRAGFKGSDNIENQKRALEAGYGRTAYKRAEECLSHIKGLEKCIFIAPEGEMGGEILEKLAVPYQRINVSLKSTTKKDTLDCLRSFAEKKVDLIVFCGGDGTARDVCEGCGAIPVLGVPAGVKMYSGCFAVNPQAAGYLLKDYILDKRYSFELREVMDLDEEFLGKYSVSAKLYGYLSVLNAGARLQGTKAASSVNPFEAEELAEKIVSDMKQDVLYIIGPGSTTYQIKKAVCNDGTLIGVDAVRNGKIIGKDADEKTLIHLTKQSAAAEIIVTCIGGAGFVFGRGNQQISAQVIRLVGKEHIHLAVTKSKLASLNKRPMYVDTDDRDIDNYLSGYYKINFNKRESTVYKIQSM